MAKESHIVVFKPHTQSTKEYMVVVDETEYKKWKGDKANPGDKTVPLVQIVDGFLIFASETGSQGKWLKPAAGEIASDFSDFNPDGSVKPGVYDATEKAEEDDEEGPAFDEDEGKRKGKVRKVLEEDAIRITLERGKLQTTKNLGSGPAADMNPGKGSGQSTGNLGTQGR